MARTISGTVSTPDGSGLAGAWLAGLPGAPVTADDGTFSTGVSESWSGEVTPRWPGYEFEPATFQISAGSDDLVLEIAARERRPGFSRLWIATDDSTATLGGILARNEDLVLLLPGVYSDPSLLDNLPDGVTVLGRPGAEPVVFRHGQRASISSRLGHLHNIDFESLDNNDPALWLDGASLVRLGHCRFLSADQGIGLRITDANDVLIEDSLWSDSFSALFFDEGHATGDLMIRRGIFSANTNGIEARSNPALGVHFENVSFADHSFLAADLSSGIRQAHLSNLIFDSNHTGLVIGDLAQPATLSHGVFYNHETDAIRVRDGLDLTVHDSIFLDNICAIDGAQVPVAIDHGLFYEGWIWAGPDYDIDDPTVLRVDPLLADPAAGDFRPLPGSPALGSGRDGADMGPFGGPLGDRWDPESPLAEPTLLRLTILDTPRHFAVGDRPTFRAEGLFSGGFTADVRALVEWSSSDPAVLSPLAGGEFEALEPGTAEVSASYGDRSTSLLVVISESPAAVSLPPLLPETFEARDPRDSEMQSRAVAEGSESVPKAAADAQGWTLTDPLVTGRARHSITLLADGRLLVAGGQLAGEVLAEVEIFDPVAGRWQRAAPMDTARQYHSATLLGDGRVLVAGGQQEERLTSAEIYDPRSDDWSPATDLLAPRSLHSATLLNDGRLLVAGGDDPAPGAPSSAELYDPVQNNWFPVGSMSNERAAHSATLLPSGRVLVVHLDEAEIYDPAFFSWTPTVAPPKDFGAPHTATRLVDGRVLVAGGTNGLAYLFDPEELQWIPAGAMAFPRVDHRAVLLPDGRVLVAGGTGSLGNPTETELFDPVSVSWALAGEMSSQRRDLAMALLPTGHVLLVGGRGFFGETTRCEIFRPTPPPLEQAAPLSEPRFDFALTTLVDGRILVAGGRHSGAVPSVEIYDPAGDTWTPAAPLATAGGGRTAILLADDTVLLVGPFEAERWNPDTDTWSLAGSRHFPGGGTRAVLLPSSQVLAVSPAGSEIYDPGSDTWSPTGSMVTPRMAPTLDVLPSGEVLAAGGRLEGTGNNAAGVLKSAELFDPNTGQWRETGAMRWPREDHFAVLLPSGEVLAGGGDEGELLLLETEIYDPVTGLWRLEAEMASPRRHAAAVVLANGEVWVSGGDGIGDGPEATSEIFSSVTGSWRPGPDLPEGRTRHRAVSLDGGQALLVGGHDADVRALEPVLRLSSGSGRQGPVITDLDGSLRYGEPLVVTGSFFGGGTEAHGGSPGHAAANLPTLTLQALEGGRIHWIVPEPREPVGIDPPGWADDPMTLEISELPPGLDPGTHRLTVWRAGVPGPSRLLPFECSLAIVQPPESPTVELGATAELRVEALGARRYQWRRNGALIAGATDPIYRTPPVGPEDAGARYDVVLDSGCRQETTLSVILSVLDFDPPEAQVVTPRGGDYWLLPQVGEAPRSETVVWDMQDNVRICRVEVALQASPGDEGPWTTVDDGLQVFESPTCEPPGISIQNTTYELRPDQPPSGSDGSSYRIRLRVRDLSGQETEAIGGPFSIVRANPESIRTLVLTHSGRLDRFFGNSERQRLQSHLQDWMGHPSVAGLLVDLAQIQELETLYEAWDQSPDAATSVLHANELLFGRGEPDQEDHVPGIHARLLELLRIFPGARYLVIVGDDRIVPMARVRDGATLWPESRYTDPILGELDPDSSPAARALSEDHFLTDDPLALETPVSPYHLDDTLAIPDLAVGRLVETPDEMISTLTGFLERDGVLRLDTLDPDTGHRVLVTGYDFLTDVARLDAERWREAYGLPPEHSGVDSRRVGVEEPWDAPDLLDTLCAEGDPYGVLHLNGHATHFQEGVPGPTSYDIRGLAADRLRAVDACGGDPLDLSGRLIYTVGCHGGLPVPDSSAEAPPENALDLPQTYLGLGATAYLANSGFGWGLDIGVGYSERLVQIFTDELTRGGPVVVGSAMARSKLRYFLEIRHFDLYHQKTLMQWTLFGLPMVSLITGIETEPEEVPVDPLETFPDLPRPHPDEIHLRPPGTGGLGGNPPPPYMVTADFRPNVTAEGLYVKRDGLTGAEVTRDGCPETEHPAGCYFTLLDLASAGNAGTGDLPIEPYLVYDMRQEGSSLHGTLWLGGRYAIERNWTPAFGEPISNGPPGDPSVAPQYILVPPVEPRSPEDGDLPCRAADTAPNTIVVTAGEVLPAPEGDTSRHHRILEVDLEMFYLTTGAEFPCDREGPRFGPAPFEEERYHQVVGSTLHWAVPVSDDEAGVWRVVAVIDDGSTETESTGAWLPVELEQDGDLWRAQRELPATGPLRYVLQAVDRSGNVGWLQWEPAETGEPPEETLGTTGIELRVADVQVVEFTPEPTDLAPTLDSQPNPLEPGSAYEYRLRVENYGPAEAAAIRAEIHLPPTARYEGFIIDDAPWSCEEGEEGAVPVLCRLSSLASGAAATVRLRATSPEAPGAYTTIAQVSAAAEDPVPENNLVSEWTQVVTLDLVDVQLELSNGVEILEQGTPISYLLTLHNHGPAVLERAFLFLDTGILETVTIEPSQGTFDGEGWNELHLAPGSVAELQIHGRVPEASAGSEIEVRAEVVPPLGQTDPNGSDNAASDLDAIVDGPPRVVGLRTVAESPGRYLELRQGTEAAVTQLLLELSEEVTGAESTAVYRLLGPGEDGHFQTETCESPAPDDLPLSFEVGWLPDERIAAIRPEMAPLPRGRYRLLVCPGITDIGGQPLAGAPWTLDFEVIVEHLLQQPNFDLGIAAWESVPPRQGFLLPDSSDAGAAPTSGAVRIGGVETGDPGALAQCLPVTGGETLRLSARFLGVADSASPEARIRAQLFAAPDCAGDPVATFERTPVPLPAGETWLRLPRWTQELPESLTSMAVLFSVESTEDGVFEVLLDDLEVFLDSTIFRDGFESGDTERWSQTVP